MDSPQRIIWHLSEYDKVLWTSVSGPSTGGQKKNLPKTNLKPPEFVGNRSNTSIKACFGPLTSKNPPVWGINSPRGTWSTNWTRFRVMIQFSVSFDDDPYIFFGFSDDKIRNKTRKGSIWELASAHARTVWWVTFSSATRSIGTDFVWFLSLESMTSEKITNVPILQENGRAVLIFGRRLTSTTTTVQRIHKYFLWIRISRFGTV